MKKVSGTRMPPRSGCEIVFLALKQYAYSARNKIYYDLTLKNCSNL